MNYLNPIMAQEAKEAFMPFHRAIGIGSFVACTIQAIIGHTEYIILMSNEKEDS